MHASNKQSTAEIGELIEEYYSGLVERLPAVPAEPLQSPVVPCPKCSEPMELVRPQLALPIALCDSG